MKAALLATMIFAAPPRVVVVTPHAPPPKPIVKTDFAAKPLDHGALRLSNRSLPDAAFEHKVTTSLESPFMFFRSWNGAFHHDLKELAARGVPGGTGPVCGDPHPDNFGFLRTAKGTEYAFNDYDDAGRGPVAIDAVRYFTALRVAFPGKDKLFAQMLDEYVDHVKGAPAKITLPNSLSPDWAKVQAKTLDKFTSDKSFVLGDKTRLSAPAPKLAEKVRALAARDEHFGGAEVLDVAMRAKDYGGSAGNDRIWALVRRGNNTRTILEFKEAVTPAIEELGGPSLSHEKRLVLAKSTFLERGEENNLFPVTLDGQNYVVRDRGRMQNVDIGELSGDDRRAVLSSQVAILARVHGPGWTDVDRTQIRAWLDQSSETLADRWTKAYESERAR